MLGTACTVIFSGVNAIYTGSGCNSFFPDPASKVCELVPFTQPSLNRYLSPYLGVFCDCFVSVFFSLVDFSLIQLHLRF